MATLIINRYDSKCSACGRGASAYERSHETALSWAGPDVGCGAVYDAVSSSYTGMADRLRQMRPDLPLDKGYINELQ